MPFPGLFAAALLAVAPPAPHFSTDQAAKCAAIYAFTLDAMMAAPNVPSGIRKQTRNGLASWEYELSASAPEAPPQVLQAAVDAAMQELYGNMPEGQGEEAAAARGAYLTRSSADCAERLDTAYNGEEHPVIPFMRKADREAGILPRPAPTAMSAPEAPESEKKSGLR